MSAVSEIKASAVDIGKSAKPLLAPLSNKFNVNLSDIIGRALDKVKFGKNKSPDVTEAIKQQSADKVIERLGDFGGVIDMETGSVGFPELKAAYIDFYRKPKSKEAIINSLVATGKYSLEQATAISEKIIPIAASIGAIGATAAVATGVAANVEVGGPIWDTIGIPAISLVMASLASAAVSEIGRAHV